MTLPNFLGIGVQRAATTWLHKCLQAHPEVYLPEEKELHFFSWKYENGIDWYADHFAAAGEATAIGEITPNYLHEAPLQRIHDLLPDARILIILREPLSRAFSAYRLLNQKFKGMTFEEACRSSMGDYLISQSLYAGRLEELFSIYPREQILVQLFDDVNSRPAEVFGDVCRHLHVSEIAPPGEVHQTFNHILYPRAQAFLAKMGLTWAVECIKKTPLGDAIKRFSKHKQAAQVEHEHESHFVNELREKFDEDIRRVEPMISRDLSAWMRQQSVHA